jgi:archaemetzincin
LERSASPVPPRTLQLVSVGNPPPSALNAFDASLAAQLGIQLAPNREQQPAPGYAFNKDRNQYHCSAILRRLTAAMGAADFLLGVTDVDLFVPEMPFVFGEADRESRTAVISVFRLWQGGPLEAQQRRLSGEALHQIGHLIGLSNCDDPKCAMFLATTLAECDRRGPELCNACRNELAKLSR